MPFFFDEAVAKTFWLGSADAAAQASGSCHDGLSTKVAGAVGALFVLGAERVPKYACFSSPRVAALTWRWGSVLVPCTRKLRATQNRFCALQASVVRG